MLGKLFGAAFGFMTGGPLGALMGAAVGHAVDQNRSSSEPADADQREAAQPAFNRAVFQLMGYLAKADGRVSEQHIAAARAIMDYLHLNSADRRAAIACFTEGKQPGFMIDAAIAAFQRDCSHRHYSALLQQMLELLLNVAYAGGDPSSMAYARLVAIAERLGLARLQFEALHTLFRARRWAQHSGPGAGPEWSGRHRPPATAVNSLSEAYRVLGLSSDAGLDQIKLAYRRLIGKHHPDKLSAKGVSSAELAQATEKTRELTAAYERIRAARGF